MHRNMRAGRFAALVVIAPCASAFGVPLDIVLPDNAPDVVGGLIGVSYDADTDRLTANGMALSYDNGDGNQLTIDGPRPWSVVAIIDDAGVFQSGSLSIGGFLPTLGFTSGTLLTADLTGLGFRESGGDPLEFIWSVTGGDTAGDYGSAAATILSFTNFPGSWEHDWDNDPFPIGTGVSDTGVPAPAGIASLAICGIGIACRRRRA